MGIEELLKDKRAAIIRIATEHGAHDIRVFGSFARGEAGPDSDVDLLVEMDQDRSLMDLSSLLLDMEELLGRKVDIVEPEGLHWYIRDSILKEAVRL